jgi:MoaA/NifB/PqqE/SkfB family radical SAM enzyme
VTATITPVRPVELESPPLAENAFPPDSAHSAPVPTPRSSLNKKLRLFRSYITGKPIWITWQVTYNCNYGCSFCTYWQNDFKPHEENSVEDFRIGARKLSELGSLFISLAGGEPLLRPDLHEIVGVLAQDHFPFMVTSGSGMTPRRASQLWNNGLWGCSVSIDYADPEKHSRNRGVKYAFERSIQAIEQLLAARTNPALQRIQMVSVLTDDNLDQMEPLCLLARELGVFWQVQPYSVMKTGNEDQRHRQGANEVMLDLKRRYPKTFRSNPVFLEKFDQAANGGVTGCIAGKAMFNIDNQMVASKCVEFNKAEPCGNLRTDSMAEVLAKLHSAHARNTCADCWYSCRGEVEVLYQPRGFLNAMPTFLWQGASQRKAGLPASGRRSNGGAILAPAGVQSKEDMR